MKQKKLLKYKTKYFLLTFMTCKTKLFAHISPVGRYFSLHHSTYINILYLIRQVKCHIKTYRVGLRFILRLT